MFPVSTPDSHRRPPSQTAIDELFGKAHSARIWLGGAAYGKPLGNQLIIELSAADLPALRDALRVVPSGEPFACHCRGDLTIELRGRLFRIGVISIHHAHSLRLEGDYADAQLVDGKALFLLLAQRGSPQFLASYEAGLVSAKRAESVRDAWTEAAPAILRDKLTPLEVGPMGLPPHESSTVFDDAVATLRSTGQTDSHIAAQLLSWLGSANSPWSGFPGYEMAALALLRRLPLDSVRDAVLAADDERTLLGAARFVSDHEVVSYRKRFVRSIPLGLFPRFQARIALLPIGESDLKDAAARLHRAQQVAQSRQKELPRFDSRESFTCVAESDDGPWSSLATNGSILCGVDVYAVVRIDLALRKLIPLSSYSGSPFTELVFVGDRLFAVRSNESRIDEISLDGNGRREVVHDVPRALRPVAAGRTLCFVSAPFETQERNGIRTSVQRTALARLSGDSIEVIARLPDAVAAIAGDEQSLCFGCTNLDRKGALFHISPSGGQARELAKVSELGDVRATPNMVMHKGTLFYANGKQLMRVPMSGGNAEALCKLKEPIAALVVLADGIVLLSGDVFSPDWRISKLPLDGGDASPIATLPRRPHHNLHMVAMQDAAYFALEEKIYRVR